MKRKIDEIYKDSFAQQEMPFDPKAWDNASLLLDKRKKKKRLILLWWLLFSLIQFAGGMYLIIYSDNNDSLPQEFAEKDLNQNETPVIVSSDKTGNNNTLVDIEPNNPEPELNSVINSQPIIQDRTISQEKLVLQDAIADTNLKDIDSNSSTVKDSGFSTETLPSNTTENSNAVKIENNESYQRLLFNIAAIPLRNPGITFLNELIPKCLEFDRKRYIYTKDIQPFSAQESIGRLRGLIEYGTQSQLGVGLMAIIGNKDGIFLTGGLMYSRLDLRGQEIAQSSTSFYSFGRQDVHRSFISNEQHSIQLPFHLNYMNRRTFFYTGFKLSYLVGVKGDIVTIGGDAADTETKWLKEYGQKTSNLMWESGVGVKAFKSVYLGIRMSYDLTSPFNNTYFSNVGLPKPDFQKFRFSIQMHYDLFK